MSKLGRSRVIAVSVVDGEKGSVLYNKTATVRADAELEAQKIMALAIERMASDFSAERSVYTVPLPDPQLRGRIIGAEGRNIRTFEKLTGMQLVMDDDPTHVLVSGFNPVKREVAKRALERLIERGVAKINYYTALADAAAVRMRANAATDPRAGYTGLMKGVQAGIAAEVERCMQRWGSTNQAAAVLRSARPWREVEHLIIYNFTDKAEARVPEAMANGRRDLSAIPGVRRVFTGTAVTPDAKYQHCWLVRFASSDVIPSYRDHPAHKRFADAEFRPFADGRISIDYVAVEEEA